MARTLTFSYEGQSFACAIDKVDRDSLYGGIEIVTHDVDGRPCALATLAADGRTLIPSGGTAFAYMNDAGHWLERADLVPVDAHGNRLNTVPSSFQTPLELEARTTPERFLDHAIRLAYALEPGETPLPARLATALAEGAIFKLEFSYRGGVGADPAFLMMGSEGTVWLLVGAENDVNFVGLAQAGSRAAAEDAAADDDLDFDML